MNYIIRQKYRLILNCMWLLIWPFGILISSLKRIESTTYRLLLNLLGFYLGYSMILRDGSDGSRIGARFLRNIDLTLNDFLQIISSTYSGRGGNPDFYLTTISFLTSRITDNQNLFFGIIGFIYYRFFFKFYARIVVYLKLNGVVPRHHLLLWCVLFGICLVYPFSAGVNAVRFPLATFVYFYGVISYILLKEKKYAVLVVSSVFVHFAFIPVVVAFLVYLLMKSIGNLYILNLLIISIAVASFFISEGGSYIENSDLVGTSIESKIDSYSDTNYNLDRSQHFSKLPWYIRMSQLLPYYYSILVLLITQLPGFSIQFSKETKSLLVLSLLLIVVSFIAGSATGPINNRYIKLSVMSAMVYLVFLYVVNTRSRLVKTLMALFVPVGLFQLYSVIRTDLEVYNFVTYFGNIFIFLAAGDFKPIIDIIK